MADLPLSHIPLLFALGLLFLLGFISYATYRTGQLLKVWEPEMNLLLLPTENMARLGMIGVCVVLGLVSGVGASTLGWRPAAPVEDVGLGVAAGLGLSLALALPTLWVKAHRPHWYSDVIVRSILPRSRREWPAVVVALLPVALLEELIFRSLLLGGLSPYVNVVFFAVAASIYFGLLHMPQGEWGVLGVSLVGLALSALFLWRGSLLVVVVAHWVANVAQLAQARWWAQRARED
ncbi:MAG: CPBP family intramembrane metalloprotease [Chloroflexi bacterium]|nr:MAG: CPBP family intramembrane metalloprotease [Chloroflexota bacterium]